MPEAWHAKDVDEVAASLATTPAGLSQAEADARLQTVGPSEFEEARETGVPALIGRQLKSALVLVLLLAAALSVVTGDFLEAGAILFIVVLNSAMGALQEGRAEKALAALRQLSAPHARVRREGEPTDLESRLIVPGDVFLIEAGDVVPADGRVIEAWDLQVNEAVLTGEFMPETKSSAAAPFDTMLADRTSMAYQGTSVTRGRGACIAVATGPGTEMGRIAGLVRSAKQEATPLQRELDRFGNLLIVAALLVALVVLGTGLLRGVGGTEMLLVAISLAVAAIPEGLPASATIVLALGVQRMARRNVIVRRLSSVETLGAVTTIFTDKTGTLTQNRMTVQKVWPSDSVEADLVMVLCNDASIGDAGPQGDPTETALLEYAAARGTDPDDLRNAWRRIDEVPFDSSRAMMSVVVEGPGGERLVLSKGSPEAIFRLCHDGQARLADARPAVEALAGEGLRVLALARRRAGNEEEEIERDLELVALVGLGDSLRAEAASALAAAREAGLRSVMLTGDHPTTARAIGSQLGLGGDPLTGRDVNQLSADELARVLEETEIFARVTSEDKLRFIEAAKKRGEIVAMTGDGVNDAPALRAADVGIAMGEGGTAVAREASDIVLVDNSFASIVAAISEGRRIYANVRRFVHFLLSCNTGEIIAIFLVVMVWSESPFTPLQILFVNLLTDGLPALALGLEPPRTAPITGAPRQAGASIVSSRSLVPILGIGGSVAAVTIVAYGLGRHWEDAELGRSLALATLVGAHLLVSFAFRDEDRGALSLPMNWVLVVACLASLAFLAAVFGIAALEVSSLSAGHVLLVVCLSLAPVLAAELVKASGLLRRLHLLPEETL
jgi:Ca2+-transporting ATPase